MSKKRASPVSPTASYQALEAQAKRAHHADAEGSGSFPKQEGGAGGGGVDSPLTVLDSDEEEADDGGRSSDVELIQGPTGGSGMDGVVEELPTVIAQDFKGKGREQQLPTPPPNDSTGSSSSGPLSPKKEFSKDFKACKEMWGGKEGGYVHEDASGEAMIRKLRAGDQDYSISCVAYFLDEEEVSQTLGINLTITELESYPSSYSIYIYPEDDNPPKHLAETLEYFPTSVNRKTLPQLVRTILRSLAGEAMSEVATQEDEDEQLDGEDGEEDEWADWGGGTMGGGKKNASGHKGVRADPKVDYEVLKKDFKAMFNAGYRPGFYRISDDEIIISISVLFRNLNVPAETLERWDSRLHESHPTSRLILLMNIGPSYPPKKIGNEYQRVQTKPSLWVGLGDEYKPSLETIKKTCWKFSGQPLASLASDLAQASADAPVRPSDFQPFLLSAPLASLLNEQFLALMNARIKNPKLGWPAVEKMVGKGASSSVGGSASLSAAEMKECKQADAEEKGLGRELPKDSWGSSGSGKDNYCLMAFEYLLRRFTLATRFCLNCYHPVPVESLRPYVCESELCVYAYQGLGLGPPVEYEIRENPTVVDILLTFTYVACREGNENSLPETGFPNGLHIEVPIDILSSANIPITYKQIGEPSATEVTFDDLTTLAAKKEALAGLIERIPRVSDLREGLLKGKALKEIAPEVPRGALGTLRWIVASNTSYLKEAAYDERITSISDAEYRQFRFVVGNPAKELAFKNAIDAASSRSPHTKTYPSILAFHGSPARNWHNILRNGLRYDYVANARAYGNGIYFANEGSVSLNHYAQSTGSHRANSDFLVSSCSALVEIVNSRSEFVSSNPYLVVSDTTWCQPRYLLVKGQPNEKEDESESPARPPPRHACMSSKAVKDPTYSLKVSSMEVTIAESEAKGRTVERSRLDDDDWTIEDRAIIFGVDDDDAAMEVVSDSDDEPAFVFQPSSEERLEKCHLLPPPSGSAGTTRSLANAFKALVAEQSSKNAGGVYINPEHESLYSWVVELHSFPTDSQLHKDLLKHNLPSVLAEIRFPSSYPFSPPFVRVLHPRFLPFAAGGGGHITAGGSICSELLTSTGWNAAYSVSAVLTELATNMTVAPEAKIDPRHWDIPYTSQESADAYKRVAQQHGWAIPPDFNKLFASSSF